MTSRPYSMGVRKVLDHLREEQESAREELCWVLTTLPERSGLNMLTTVQTSERVC